MTENDRQQLLEQFRTIGAASERVNRTLVSGIMRFAEQLRRMYVRVEGDHVLVLTAGGRYLRTPLSARDRYGSPAALVRSAAPVPSYTRHCTGEHEAARDTRRSRRRLEVVYRSDR